MARDKRKLKKSTILIIILYIIIFIGLSYFTIYYFNKYEKEKNENKQLTNRLNLITTDYNNESKNQEDINNRINELNNIEENIKKEKEEVFKLAKNLENKILSNETNYKIAYLTFDDGPYYLTNEYLKILKENKVKATFFTIGLDKDICYDNNNASCKETYKLIVDNGHTIANHTYSHLIHRGLYNSSLSFITEVKKQEDLIKERTGVTTNIVRFPGGSSTSGNLKNSIIKELRNNNYGWVDWSALDGDGGYLTSTTVAWNNFTNSINENIEVVLFHDYSNITIQILDDAIKYLKDNNYILLPLFYDSVKVNK